MLTLDDNKPAANAAGPVSTLSDTLLRDYIRSGFHTWGPSGAEFVLSRTAYPGQIRHLSASAQEHIDVLAELMKRGLWLPRDKLDFARLPDGRFILVNGHHRLSAQTKAKANVEWTIVIHDVDDMAGAARLYHSFDTNTRLRTKLQVVRAEGLAAELGVAPAVATAAYSAAPLIAAELDPARSARDVIAERILDLRFDLVREYGDAVRLFEKCIYPADWEMKRRLFRIGSMAVAMVTLRYEPVKAAAFWGLVAEDTGLERGHPCHTYIRTIRARDAGQNAWFSGAWAASAWNAYMRGQFPTHFNLGEPRPLKVIGTPFEKGRGRPDRRPRSAEKTPSQEPSSQEPQTM